MSNIGAEPELEGIAPAENPTEYIEETVWHRVVAWGRQGEICAQRLKKGQSVFVEGSLRSHKYVDKDNISRMAFEVHAESVGFLPSGMSSRSRELASEAVLDS